MMYVTGPLGPQCSPRGIGAIIPYSTPNQQIAFARANNNTLPIFQGPVNAIVTNPLFPWQQPWRQPWQPDPSCATCPDNGGGCFYPPNTQFAANTCPAGTYLSVRNFDNGICATCIVR